MKNNMQKQLKRYLSEIADVIPNSYPYKRLLMQEIKRDLCTYMEEHKDAGFEDLLMEFGSASEIVDAFMEQLSGKESTASIRKRKRYITVVYFTTALAIMAIAAYIFHVYKQDSLYIEETLSVYDGTELLEDDSETSMPEEN